MTGRRREAAMRAEECRHGEKMAALHGDGGEGWAAKLVWWEGITVMGMGVWGRKSGIRGYGRTHGFA